MSHVIVPLVEVFGVIYCVVSYCFVGSVLDLKTNPIGWIGFALAPLILAYGIVRSIGTLVMERFKR